MFELVDGSPNHQAMVRLALGQDPALPHRAGEYGVAAKWFLRRFEDGVVRRIPSEADLARVHEELPGVAVQVTAEEGERLSDMTQQDSYSFELADVYVGAADEQELVEKYERCLSMLPFEIEDLPDEEAPR
jgi:hypothetical protein